MHIHSQHTHDFLLELVSGLMKDPRSLEHWRCLYYNAELAHNNAFAQPKTPAEMQRLVVKLTANLAHEAALEGTEMILLPDGDIFILGKDLTVSVLDAILNVIQWDTAQGDITHAVTIYDLLRQWHELRSLIEHKTGQHITPSTASAIAEAITPLPRSVLNEFASLQEMFHATKYTRDPAAPLKILVVEDDVVSRQLVACAFKKEHNLITAKNAQEAISQYLLYSPDIVFLDINLPDYNGFQVLHYLRQQDAKAFIVMFSGNDDLANISQALAAGARGFVAKPFNRDKLQRYVTEYKLSHGG